MPKTKSVPSITSIQLNFDEVEKYSDNSLLSLAMFTLRNLRKKPYRGTLRYNAVQSLRGKNYVGVRFILNDYEVLRVGFQPPPDFSRMSF